MKKNYISMLRLLALGAISSAIILSGCRLETGAETEVQNDSEEMEEKTTGAVTLEVYQQLEKGMSYEEVKEIIGTEGKQMTQEGDSNPAYIWDGESEGSFLSISFKRDKLSTRTQVGLR